MEKLIDILLCYRNGQKEKIALDYPLPNPLYIALSRTKHRFDHYACMIDGKSQEIEFVIYLESIPEET